MKTIFGLMAALSLWLTSGQSIAPAIAQSNYPDKPIRILVGFSAGSAILATLACIVLNVAFVLSAV